MSQVLLLGLAIDHHIIYVCHCIVHNVKQNLIHQALECCWGIPKAKGHEHILKLSGSCTKSCLLNIGGIHRHLVESFIKIKFREIHCLTQMVDNLIHPRHQVRVRQSTQRCTDPSFFLTEIMGDDQGLRECRLMPAASRSCISACSWSFHAGARQYGAVLKGGELEVLITCSTSEALPGVVLMTSLKEFSSVSSSAFCSISKLESEGPGPVVCSSSSFSATTTLNSRASGVFYGRSMFT